MYKFNVEETTKELIEWIRNWFEENGKGCNAVLGISGGKDSTVAAALCVEALGKDRVIGVMMPNGEQYDIEDSKAIIAHLGIKGYTVNIKKAYDSIASQTEELVGSLSAQTKINLAPRIRMSALYAMSQSLNGRVVNTCNLSETMVSYETRWGDAVGDFSPLANLTVAEVKEIGRLLNVPAYLVDKTPSDGLCGSSDEEALGVLYAEIDEYIRTGSTNQEAKEKIDAKYRNSMFKRKPIPVYDPGIKNYLL